GSILEGISHRIADDGGFVGIRSFPAEVCGFDVFFGIVPSASGVGHGDGEHGASSESSGEHTAEGGGSKEYSHHYRRCNGQDSWQHHFPEGSGGGYVHTTFRVWVGFSFHKAFDFMKLPTDFYYHAHRRSSYRAHRHGREEEGETSSDKESDHDLRLSNINSFEMSCFRVSGEKSNSCESGRTDCKSFSNRSSSVSDCV